METTLSVEPPHGVGAGLDELLKRASAYLPAEAVAEVEHACRFAENAHNGQMRRSGDPYITHPIAAATILTGLQLDAHTIEAGLLHDVVEDCGVSLDTIETEFGVDVAHLVDGVTKLGKIIWQTDAPAARRDGEDAHAENLRKMFFAMADDIRVVLIKLADRLHNMRTLDPMPPHKRRSIAQETLEIFAPLANRLGIWQIKWELEDLAFRHLQPDRYKEIAKLVADRRRQREHYIAEVASRLGEELRAQGVEAEVTGRAKHIYSIHNKMEKYALQGKDFAQIYDLLAVRILVQGVQDCYAALGVVHHIWHPIPGQFDDYISNPKESMYQSLHTTVMGPEARPLEIQIRTYEMHRVAEYGIAAHWRYKEGGKRNDAFNEKVAWLRQLIEWQKEVSGAREFVEGVKTDIFRDQVFVYTPRGEIKDLPTGSTPLDFAFRIHTDLGYRTVGAKVNSRLVSLDYQLKNGDIVEIIGSKASRGPSLDWLNANLGFVRTSHAREKIRQWFRRQARAENIERGKEMLEKELKRLGFSVPLEEIAHLFKYDKTDDFLAAIGYGEVSTHNVAVRLAQAHDRSTGPEIGVNVRPVSPTSAVEVMGVGDLLTRMANCCNPVPGDDIIGYVTRTSGVTVHRADCKNILNEEERDRVVPVNWGAMSETLFPVPVRIEAWDRVGLLRDISTLVSEEKVNIAGVHTEPQANRTTRVQLVLHLRSISQLSRVLSKLEGVKGVFSVTRDAGIARAGSN